MPGRVARGEARVLVVVACPPSSGRLRVGGGGGASSPALSSRALVTARPPDFAIRLAPRSMAAIMDRERFKMADCANGLLVRVPVVAAWAAFGAERRRSSLPPLRGGVGEVLGEVSLRLIRPGWCPSSSVAAAIRGEPWRGSMTGGSTAASLMGVAAVGGGPEAAGIVACGQAVRSSLPVLDLVQ